MFNQVTIVGRFTRDPELTYTKDGIAVCNFTLAVQRSFRNAQGEFDADFIPVTAWRKQAENCANFLGKGRLVAVEGRLQIRSYDDQNGIRRKAAEVVADQVRFLDRARDGSSPDEGMSAGPPEPEFDDVPF